MCEECIYNKIILKCRKCENSISPYNEYLGECKDCYKRITKK